MLKLKTALYALLPFLGLFGITASGCATTTEQQGDENVGAAEQALTPEQCEYFDVNGTVQICHSLPNGKFKMLRVNEQGCINGHSGHSGDYVASLDPNSSLYDPTCQGLGCLPLAAPCDPTVPCCDGSSCVDGACVADEPESACPCTVFGDWVAPPPGSYGSCAADLNQISLYLINGTFTPITASAYGSGNCGTPNGQLNGIGEAAARACLADLKAWDLAGPAVCAGCYDGTLCAGTGSMCTNYGDGAFCY